jgi:hypothetical protein
VTAGPAAGDRYHRQTVAVLRNRAGRFAGKHLQKPIGCERRQRWVADHRQARSVEGRQSRAIEKRRVQGRDVGEADERLRCLRDRVEIEQRDHLR